jgi:hypothetical protein
MVKLKVLKRFRFLSFICISVLALSGCAGTTAPSPKFWENFYKFDVTSDEFKQFSMEEFSNTKSNDEFLNLVSQEYKTLAKQLEFISTSLNDNQAKFSESDIAQIAEGKRFLANLRNGLLREIDNIQSLLQTGCPDTYSDANAVQIKRCGEVNLGWGDLRSVALKCSFVKASDSFSTIEGFEVSRVKTISGMSDGLIKACQTFPESHNYRGHPKSVGLTWIPEKFQNDLDSDKNYIIVEVAEGLWASKVGDLSILELAVNSSWHGYCAPYRKYEELLRDADLLLGSIKSGDCRN